MSRLVMRARVNSWLIMHSVRGVPAVYYLCMSAWLPAGKRVNSWLIMHSLSAPAGCVLFVNERVAACQ